MISQAKPINFGVRSIGFFLFCYGFLVSLRLVFSVRHRYYCGFGYAATSQHEYGTRAHK